MGILEVKRVSSAIGLIVSWDVYLDGKKVGKLKNGKSIECEVSPGTHVAYVSTPQWFSNEVSFVIDEAHSKAVIECSVGKAGKSQVVASAAFGVIGAAVSSANHKGENKIDAVLIE